MGEEASGIDAALLSRLYRLEAREAIQDAIAAYAHGANKRDLAHFLRAFHADAEWDVGSTSFSGHEEIGQAISYQWATQPGTHHWNSNTVITMVNLDRAEALTDVCALTQHSDGTHTLTAGSYADTFTRRAGRWAIAVRRASAHRTVEISTLTSGDA